MQGKDLHVHLEVTRTCVASLSKELGKAELVKGKRVFPFGKAVTSATQVLCAYFLHRIRGEMLC